MDEALRSVSRAIVITHHPAFSGLNFPETGPPTVDRMLWRAFSGNRIDIGKNFNFHKSVSNADWPATVRFSLRR